MPITYRCIALSNPPGPGILVRVGVTRSDAPGEMVFEGLVHRADLVDVGQINPTPFMRRIGRALLLGATPASLIGLQETE